MPASTRSDDIGVNRPPTRSADRLSVPGKAMPLRMLRRPLTSATTSAFSVIARAIDTP